MAQAHNPPNFFEMPMPASIRKSLAAGEITPELFALLREGQTLLESGDAEASLAKLVDAHELSGDNPFTLRVIGAFMFSVGRFREALSIYLRLQEVEPDELDVLHSIATLLYSLREFEPAMEMIRGLLEQHPEEASLWLTAGLIACEIELWQEGRAFLEHSLALDPSDATTQMNVGWLQRLDGDLDLAAATYETALQLNPGSLAAKFNQALVLLARGDYLAGFEAYEVRTQPGSHARVLRDREFPLWDAGRFTNERVLIGGEQGIGDQLHFAPDLGVLLEDLRAPVLEIHGKLAPLFQRTFPDLEVRPQMFVDVENGAKLVYPWIDAEARQFDALINLGSIPLYVRKTRGQWPARQPGYLKTDVARTAVFSDHLAALEPGPRIGVIWKSQLTLGRRSGAYAPLLQWADFLSRFKGVTFVSLQYSKDADVGIEEFARHGVKVHQIPGLDQLNDIDGVASLIAALDFVVGAKTAPIMLAAAIGTPSLALTGGTPWARPAASGFDPWLPALRETAGQIVWANAYDAATEIGHDWLRRIRNGEPILAGQPAFS
jgi:tetratricopeptide (TPR) repeat protein